MSEFYKRAARLQLDTKLLTDVRIAFRIEKSLKPRANQAEIRVWNLSEETRKRFDKDLYVVLEAGYISNLNSLFVGNLDKCDHTRSGPDWITSVRVGDGTKEIKQARVNTSFRPGTRPEEVVRTLVDRMTQSFSTKGFNLKIAAGNAITKARQGDTQGALKELTQGFVAIGGAFDELTRIGNNLGYDVSIQDKQLLFLGPHETDGKKDILLSSKTGLVGSPELAEQNHLKVRALLNGELRPGRGVIIQSESFNGRYRIERCTMQGDTHGMDWYVDMILKGL